MFTPAPHLSPVQRALQGLAAMIGGQQSARNRQVHGEHVNQFHPRGTAGHAIAPRHHQPVKR